MDPATTMTLKLLNSVKDLLAELLSLPVRKSTSGAPSNCAQYAKKTRQITWDTLISEPLDPATTITLKLMNSVKDLFSGITLTSGA